MRFNIFLISAGLIFSACGTDYPGYEKTENGLYYKLHTRSDSAKAKPGDIISFHMKYTTVSDSLLYDSWTRRDQREPGTPLKMTVGKPEYPGDIMEGFSLMAEGDSASFITSGEDFYIKSSKTTLPEFVDSGMMFVFHIRMVAVKDGKKAAAERARIKQLEMENMENIKAKEYDMIKAYLAKYKYGEEPVIRGVSYVEKKKGTGPLADSGKKVTIHYTGTLLNGSKFNSSYDFDEPVSFVLGQGKAVEGLERGLMNMRKGGKAVLIVPSSLGYGPKGLKGSVIGPFATLVYDVELLNVE